MAYTAEQYAAAGAWIAANIGNPELVAQTAAAFGISIADLTIAAQTVDSSITSAQVTSYLAPTSYTPPAPVYTPPPEPVYIPPAPVYTPPPEPVYYEPVYYEPVYTPPPEPVYYEPVYYEPVYYEPVYTPPPETVYTPPPEPVYTPPPEPVVTDPYVEAGLFILANIDNPELIAQTAIEYGLTIDDLTKAAQTVDASITAEQVAGYLSSTNFFTPPVEPVYTPPEPVYTPPEPVYTPPSETVYKPPEPVYIASDTFEFLSVGESMNYTPEQYAAAGQFIVDNINDPEKIALTAAQFGLTPQDLVDAAAAVGYTITTDQTLTYFDNAGIDYESLTVYTPEQYAAAGRFIVDNFSNPDAIAIAAETFGLTVEQLAVAARTVDPTITIDQVQGYFETANIGYETGDAYFVEPTSGFVFDTREELEAYQTRMAADAEGVARLEAAKAEETARAAAALATIEANAAAARATAAALQQQQAAAAAAAAKAAQDAAAASAAQAARDAAAKAKAAADAKLAADAKAKADAAAAAKAKAEADAKVAAERARIAAALAKAKADAAAAEKAAADAAAKAKAGLISQAQVEQTKIVAKVKQDIVTQLEQEAAALPSGGMNLLPILLAVGAYFLIGG